MGESRPEVSRRRLAMAATAVAAAVVGGVLIGDQVGAFGRQVDPHHGNHYHAADLDGDGRFSGQGDVWPPRPDHAGPPLRIDLPDAAQDAGLTASYSARSSAPGAADPLVTDHLGDDFTILQLDDNVVNGKGQRNYGRTEVTYFSRTHNQTVIVDLAGSTVLNVTTVPAHEHQLALTPEEVADAVDVAKAYWLDQGASDIENLQGYGILAFTPADQFYDVRAVYVSFHVDEDARPIYVATVDLTNSQIINARRDA